MLSWLNALSVDVGGLRCLSLILLLRHASHADEAGIIFYRRCLYTCVRLFVQKLKNCWWEIDVAWYEYVLTMPVQVTRFRWRLTLTFDLERYFHAFPVFLCLGYMWNTIISAMSVWCSAHGNLLEIISEDGHSLWIFSNMFSVADIILKL